MTDNKLLYISYLMDLKKNKLINSGLGYIFLKESHIFNWNNYAYILFYIIYNYILSLNNNKFK